MGTKFTWRWFLFVSCIAVVAWSPLRATTVSVSIRELNNSITLLSSYPAIQLTRREKVNGVAKNSDTAE